MTLACFDSLLWHCRAKRSRLRFLKSTHASRLFVSVFMFNFIVITNTSILCSIVFPTTRVIAGSPFQWRKLCNFLYLWRFSSKVDLCFCSDSSTRQSKRKWRDWDNYTCRITFVTEDVVSIYVWCVCTYTSFLTSLYIFSYHSIYLLWYHSLVSLQFECARREECVIEPLAVWCWSSLSSTISSQLWPSCSLALWQGAHPV